MKIRFGLVLSVAMSIGSMGCAAAASSGGAGGAGALPPGAEQIRPGEQPRQTDDTRAAQSALEKAGNLGDSAQAQAQPLYQQALTSANAAIAADSTNPLPYLQKGRALIGLGRYAQADSALNQAQDLRPLYQFEISPIREQAWIKIYNKAAPLVNQGDYQGAVQEFEQANAIYKERPEAMIILGQIYAQLHEDDKALENLSMAQKVIADQGQSVDSATLASWKEQAKNIPFTKAQVLADAGRFEEAISQFRKIVADNPDDVNARVNLATLMLQAEKKDSAVAILDSLMANPDLMKPRDVYLMGLRYYQADQYEKAAEAFQRTATAEPKNRDALEMWARCLRIDSAYAKVPPVADRWLALDPNNANAYLIMAQALNKQGTDTARVNQLVDQVQNLKVKLDNLSFHYITDGGGYVTGDVINVSLDPGTQVTLHFTFYGDSGNTLGTKDETVAAGSANQSTTFRADFDSTQQVGGYGYTVDVM